MDSCLGAVSTPTLPTSCTMSLWDGCLPLISSAQPPRDGSTPSCPSGPPSCVVSPSPPTLASELILLWNSSPHLHPMDSADSSVCQEDSSCCAWKLVPGTPPRLLLGTLLSNSTLPPTEPPSGEAGLFSLRGLIPAGPRCPGLSNPWMPVWSSHFCFPCSRPLRPGAHSEETGSALQGPHSGSLAGGDGGLLIYFSFVGGFPPFEPVFISSLWH